MGHIFSQYNDVPQKLEKTAKDSDVKAGAVSYKFFFY